MIRFRVLRSPASAAADAVARTRCRLLPLLAICLLPQIVSAGAMEPFLSRLARDPAHKAPARVSTLFAWDEAEARQGRARILIRTTDEADLDALRSSIAGIAPSAVWEGAAGDLCQVVAAWSDLQRIANLPGVSYVFRSPRPVPCREVVSEGVDTMRVPAFHATGNRGEGSRIAILDLGFDGYERFLGNELGDDVVVRSFFRSPGGRGDIGGDGIDHGIACAEIVHDIAPGARLYLVNVETLIDLQSAVEWLIQEHVSVISHSVGWYFGGLNGHGPINDIADKAARNDILWVNAAGNEAERHTWANARDADGDRLLEFDDGGDETLDFTLLAQGDSLELVLFWDDWPRARSLDLELELIDSEGNLLASSADQASGNPYAIRVLGWRSEDGGAVAVRVRAQGNEEGTIFHIFRIGHGVRMEEHAKSDRSLLAPADSPSALAVGAVDWRDLTLDSYSSRGAIGAAGTPKPELCAPVGVSTAIYGPTGFRGTSAATPHVAGAAGLLAAAGIHGGVYDLQWTREELIQLLSENALRLPDIEPLAWGAVRVPARVRPSAAQTGPVVFRNPAAGQVRWKTGGGDVDILDVAGRTIARCSAPFWDGRGNGGSPAPAGIYWLRSAETGASTRLVWLGQ